MKIAFCLTFFVFVFFTSGCSNAQSMSSKNILIVYLSRTNNTKAIAEIIRENVGGKMVAIELQNPYPQNYKVTVDRVADENETG